jgi:hypothetical protein
MFQYDGEIHIIDFEDNLIDFEDNLAYIAEYLDDDIPEVTIRLCNKLYASCRKICDYVLKI